MMSEQEKMLNGMIYDASDKSLVELRKKAHRLSFEYNKLLEDDPRRKDIINELIPISNNVYLQGPIQFDYGCFTSFGKRCYANFNLLVLDCAPITIGDDVFFGANVSLLTPIHPLIEKERQMTIKEDGSLTDLEYAKPIKIGNGCWIASDVKICGGVTIGNGVVIGAGSIVTRDIPDNVFAAGNPCRVIRKIEEKDSIYLKKELWEK